VKRLATVALAALVGCTSIAHADTLPIGALTPGAIGGHPVAIVCRRGFAASIRPPYDYAWRRFRVEVFERYGIPHALWRGYTIDHLVPLELDGAPMDLRNVWPEPKTEAVTKDGVENALHEAVCYEHDLTLTAAQQGIAKDWARTPVGLP
jgi:hypothetical protein